MKKIIAASIFFGVVILLLVLVNHCSAQTVALNSNTGPVGDGEKSLMIRGKVAGDWKTWLVVEAHNGYQWKDNGYDPSLTRVVCDYMPLFRKLPNGQWEIMFTSPIAKNIP